MISLKHTMYIPLFKDSTNHIVNNKPINDYTYKFPDYATVTYLDTGLQVESLKQTLPQFHFDYKNNGPCPSERVIKQPSKCYEIVFNEENDNVLSSDKKSNMFRC